MSRHLIDFEHVTVLRDGREVLSDISLRLGHPEHVAIVGPNGAGKSTLLKLVTRECYPVPNPRTTCRILDRERWNVFELRGELGIVSSDLSGVLSRAATVRDIALTGFFSSHSLEPNHEVTPTMRREAEDALAHLGIAHLADRQLGTLSSGELRRTTIARALVHHPAALIFDEPATSLDPAAQHEVREAMRSLALRGVGIILVTHQLDDVIPEIERVVFIKNGRLAGEGQKAEMFTAERLSRLFDVPLDVSVSAGLYYTRARNASLRSA